MDAPVKADSPAAMRIDRRAFVSALGIAAGGVAATTMLPSLIEIAPPAVMSPAPWAKNGTLADWTIDDQAGAFPRYADAIDSQLAAVDHTDPLEHLFPQAL